MKHYYNFKSYNFGNRRNHREALRLGGAFLLASASKLHLGVNLVLFRLRYTSSAPANNKRRTYASPKIGRKNSEEQINSFSSNSRIEGNLGIYSSANRGELPVLHGHNTFPAIDEKPPWL